MTKKSILQFSILYHVCFSPSLDLSHIHIHIYTHTCLELIDELCSPRMLQMPPVMSPHWLMLVSGLQLNKSFLITD